MDMADAFCYIEESYCQAFTGLLLCYVKSCHKILKDSIQAVGISFPTILISLELY
jgi:hypothetical protein